MWIPRAEPLTGRRAVKFTVEQDSSPVSYAEELRLWQDDTAFRTMFNRLLADSPFEAFRWETPPITTATVNRPFEFVLLDSPGLARTPDDASFAEYFSDEPERSVVAFPNLGKDAILVAPCPRGPLISYGHLGAFVRQAPEEQRHVLWQMVADVMKNRLSKVPVWLSTAGAGVAWLHVRIGDQPKYYGHAPYRNVGEAS